MKKTKRTGFGSNVELMCVMILLSLVLSFIMGGLVTKIVIGVLLFLITIAIVYVQWISKLRPGDKVVITEGEHRGRIAVVDLACTPKIAPSVMRVSSRLLIERNFHETQASHTTASGS